MMASRRLFQKFLEYLLRFQNVVSVEGLTHECLTRLLFAGASSAQDEASGPAASSHSAEEDAPILVQFGRKKPPQPADSDDSVPIAQMHLQLSEVQSTEKRKRGRPPGSGKPKVKSKRGRPRKHPVEGESRPEEAARESDGESVDLDADGLAPAAKKSRAGDVSEMEGVEGGAKVSPIQLQRKALQHTRPRSILGRQQAKGPGVEDGADSKADTGGPPLDKTAFFLANVQKFKDKKRKRREKMLAARLAKMGGDPPDGGAEKVASASERVTSASEASSRGTGLKGPRSKRRARVFVPGAEFWLPGREEESEEKQKPSKKMRVEVVKGEKKEVESGAAEGKEAPVAQETKSSPVKGSRRKKQKKAGGEQKTDGGAVASGEPVETAAQEAEALSKIRKLSRTLEPHTGGDVINGGGQKSGRKAAGSEIADGDMAGAGLEGEAKRGNKRRRVEKAEPVIVEEKEKEEAENVDAETYVEQGEEGPKFGDGEGAGGKDAEKRRPRKRARQWGKRKRGPRSGGDQGREAVSNDAPVEVVLKGEDSQGNGVIPPQDGPPKEQTGQARKQARSERIGANHTAVVIEGVGLKDDSSVQRRKNGLMGSGRGAGNGGPSPAVMSGGLDTKQAKGRSAGEGPGTVAGGQVYRRKKGRGAQERQGETVPAAEAVCVGEAAESEVVFQGDNVAPEREGGREQARPRSSGLIVKGVKGFLKRQPAAPPPADVIPEPLASPPADVIAEPQATPVLGETATGVLSEKQAKKRLDKAAEKRASGVIVKGVKGFQKKKGPEVGSLAGSQEVAREGGTGGEVLAAGDSDERTGEDAAEDQALPQKEAAPESAGAGDGFRGEVAAKDGEDEREQVDVQGVESLRKGGGKGRKKKKGGKRTGKPLAEIEVIDTAAVRSDQGAADGELGEGGAGGGEASILLLDGVGSQEEKGKHADGRNGEDQEEGREEKAGAPNGAGRKSKVPRELQALKAALGTGASADGSKAGKAFAGFLSSTRQRVR